MQIQRKAAKPQRPAVRLVRPEFTAAVRYIDGRRDIFRVVNADDMADARALVLSELGEVRSLVIALRH
ncbi:MAG: hypothetical protein U0989_09925 [Azonexus sp.]|nr:hypothetical protein [Azonexus sp.]